MSVVVRRIVPGKSDFELTEVGEHFDLVIGSGLTKLSLTLTEEGIEIHGIDGSLELRPRSANAVRVRAISPLERRE